jgi:hypothetical protein
MGNAVDIAVQTGDINDSANIGGDHQKKGDSPRATGPENKAVMPANQAKRSTPVSNAMTTRSSAQPKGTLAFTGAETSIPLTLGLIALGAGGALTLTGRRGSTATD